MSNDSWGFNAVFAYVASLRPRKSVRWSPLRDLYAVFQWDQCTPISMKGEDAMPKTVKKITCCYCDAATLVDLAKVGRGVLTCDACGARLSSARMEAVVNKPVPVRPAPTPKRAAQTATLDPRWQSAALPQQKKKAKKSKPKKRKGFLDRLEDLWDEIEDIID